MAYAGVLELAEPTLAEGETVAELLAEPTTSTPTRRLSGTTASSSCSSSRSST